ncbi:Abi family protein [Atopobium sp. oral taxon 416]|uniref:Abi family protein n=1 Tax=Atopobium sp. oral taxon 416 TaxID=712157 RepID=UPI001BA6E574|nr:Abi family protein [Atopobium sp. oral taxon 416]QUC03037.1 Abi family protein [Atopobium sp. oral taxon 416]
MLPTRSDEEPYFKLAAYRILFDKRVGGKHNGEYVGLDFGHLKDLAAIDHMLRYTLLPMTLDVEYFAKVKLIREATERADEDGYSIVDDYLASLSERNRSIRENEMERLKRDGFSGGMARKYDEDKPVWVLVELLSFGGFINFYLYCADRWKDRQMRSEHYLLRQAQALRNACAHSTDIISGFAPSEVSTIRTPKAVALALAEIGVNKRARRAKMSNLRIQQITMMAFAYRELVVGSHTGEMCRSLIKALEHRTTEHADWYSNADSVASAYRFLSRIFDSWI